MTYKRLTPEQATEQLAERIAVAQDRIESAVAALQSGQQWRDYLALQSSLHAYSANNVWLLTTQHHDAWEKGVVSTPWPICVAGFQAWRRLGRSVDKGQRGYQILAPIRHRQRMAVDADGTSRPVGVKESVASDERVETREVIGGWRVEHCWDVAQTSGDPLPEPPHPSMLRGAAPAGLWDAISAQLQDRGYAVRLVPSADGLDGANGRVTWASRLVEVRADMDEAARCKSLLHELGHALLHDPELRSVSGVLGPAGRGAREVEAESVACIVADAHGLATDDYSFPYVSTWAGEDGIEVVRASASRVAAAAKEIITRSTVPHSAGGRATDLQLAIHPEQEQLSIAASPRRDRPLEPTSTRHIDFVLGLS
ncbi:ArdC-like ssDNA-binding domain-containing protein [Segeticoccus rhizosphaerae]|uniref:ArdC-like ssDNA-binding domain-containing protein n=1 Tax=Segeticoccus rhizosphaerae TaxID=1104777 RepID=UPI00126406AA|nr:ArdC-like ssDNA-binding domain-containing protein [Segeticoccus rhizosphaerae]